MPESSSQSTKATNQQRTQSEQRVREAQTANRERDRQRNQRVFANYANSR